jgi:hypothetical protein
MTQAEHEKRLQKIEAETEEIKRQMMQFEFQHKKDIADTERRFEDRQQAMESKQDRSQKQIDHLVKLMGLSYEALDELDATVAEAGVILTRPRKHAILK